MNEMKLAKTAASMSQIFNFLSTAATVTAIVSVIFSAVCCLRKIK